MDHQSYVHGRSPREAERLADQARVLRPLIHDGVRFPPGSRLLEPGCGTGMQTAALLENSPGIDILAVDRDPGQIAKARTRLGDRAGVTFQEADLETASLEPASFDHAFVCFLLEHLSDRRAALETIRRALKPGGTITVIEGDHGCCRFFPETPAARAVWKALSVRQRRLGGEPDIGRRSHAELTGAGFVEARTELRPVWVDGTNPYLRDAFVRLIITPMVAGGVDDDVIDAETRRRGLAELEATADEGGSFFYGFFRATARVPG